MNSIPVASTESGRAKAHNSVVGANASGIEPVFAPASDTTKELHRFRTALNSAQADDGFRPFRVF
jgi:hypothetical protein